MKKISFGSLLPIILIVGCISTGYFFSYDQWVKYSASKDALAVAETQNAAVRKAQSDLEGFLTSYRRSLESQPKVDRALPAEDLELPIILTLLEDLAQTSGMKVGSINGKEASEIKSSDSNSVSYIDFDVQVQGTYEGFKNFLLLIEQNLRISDVQSVTFQVEEGLNIKFSLVVRMYYQK